MLLAPSASHVPIPTHYSTLVCCCVGANSVHEGGRGLRDRQQYEAGVRASGQALGGGGRHAGEGHGVQDYGGEGISSGLPYYDVCVALLCCCCCRPGVAYCNKYAYGGRDVGEGHSIIRTALLLFFCSTFHPPADGKNVHMLPPFQLETRFWKQNYLELV